MNPIALRLLNQRLVAPQFKEPEEVVRYMGAMQAQEYRMMRWAVASSNPSSPKTASSVATGLPSRTNAKQTFSSMNMLVIFYKNGQDTRSF